MSDATLNKVVLSGITYLTSASTQDARDKRHWEETPTVLIWNIPPHDRDGSGRCRVINQALRNKITEAVMQKGAYYSGGLFVIPTLGYVVTLYPY